jgi:hypothetical protein
MGKILKTRNLTTFAEGAILVFGVGLVCVAAYFFIPMQSATNNTKGEAVAIDSVSSVNNVEVNTPSPVVNDTVATVVVPVTQPTVTQPTVTQPTVKETKPVTKVKKEKPVTKTVKETKKKTDSRENLEIQF